MAEDDQRRRLGLRVDFLDALGHRVHWDQLGSFDARELVLESLADVDQLQFLALIEAAFHLEWSDFDRKTHFGPDCIIRVFQIAPFRSVGFRETRSSEDTRQYCERCLQACSRWSAALFRATAAARKDRRRQ